MIFKIFKSLFTQDTIKVPKTNDVGELTALLNNISNGLGEYASYAFNEESQKKKIEKGQEMLSIITDIDKKGNLLKNTSLFYSLAIAYRNYCAWFVRGDERKIYLEKCLFFLNESISASPDNIDAKSELGRLLIEEKVIRNLSKGIEILEELYSDGKMPSYLNSVLSKALRQSGNIELEERFDLCAFKDPSPAIFREERKRFRALIRKYKKENEIDKLKISLNQYYNLGVLVTICYGDHDCNSGVIGWQYDEAIKTVKKICKRIDYSFVSNGILEKSSFISNNDWKTFVNVFGESNKKFDPAKEFRKTN